MHLQDINLFRIRDVVNVNGIPDYQNVVITRISEAGVTVNGPKCGSDVVISGKAPAYLVKRGEQIAEAPVGAVIIPKAENESEDESAEASDRKPRGFYTEKMKHLTIPAKGTKFTIRDFATLNDIPVNYAYKWVVENCVEAGHAEKVEGQRGKVAVLYEV